VKFAFPFFKNLFLNIGNRGIYNGVTRVTLQVFCYKNKKKELGGHAGNGVIFKWHTYDARQAHKLNFYELGVRHMYAI